MEDPLESWLVFGSAILAGIFLVLRAATRNRLIKKRLGLSSFILIGTVILRLGDGYLATRTRLVDPRVLQEIHQLAIALAVVLAAVALLFNRFRRAEASERFPAIVQDALVIAIFALVAILVAPEQLLAASAVGALVIGLALQDTLGNLFAGWALQIEKPFFVGDWIKIGSIEGKVTEITWRATKICTKARHFCVIPNTVISKDILVNYTHPSPIIRLDKVIGLGYDAHPNHVKRVVLETIADIPEILKDPAPSVFLVDYADFSIHYQCRFWVDDFAQTEPIMDRFTTLLYYRLQREGLVIPFPIRDVRMHAEGPDHLARVREQDLAARLEFLNGVDLFADCSPEHRLEIARCLERITYAAGETVIRQGAAGDWMVFLEQGRARVVLERDDTVTQVAVLEGGQYVGEMALLTGEPRSATVIAVTDLRAYVLRKAAFRNVLVGHPEIAQKLSEVIATRRAELESKAVEVDAAGRNRRRKAAQESLLRKIQSFFGL